MARIRSVRIFSGPRDRCVHALFLIAFTSTFATLSRLAEAQTPGTITLGGTNLCADVESDSKTAGARVLSWTCNGGANQHWSPTPAGTRYQFINQNSNLCMDVSNDSLKAGRYTVTVVLTDTKGKKLAPIRKALKV